MRPLREYILLCALLAGLAVPAGAVTINGVDAEDIGARDTAYRIEPAYEFKKDSADRESWRFDQTLRAMVAKWLGLIVGYHRSVFREAGVQTVKDHAGSVGLDLETPDKTQRLETRFKLHDFSDEVDIPFSFRSELDSLWTDRIHTKISTGREPYPTPLALRGNIEKTYVQTDLFLKPLDWTELRWSGKIESISDDNHLYANELEAALRLPNLEAVRAVYLFTTENSSEQREIYYTPNHVRQHQFGGDVYLEKDELGYLYARYLYGYGHAEPDKSGWTIHTVDLSLGIKVVTGFTIGPSFSWGRTPTYESKTYSIFGRIEF